MNELASARARVSAAGFDAGTAGVTPPSDPDRRGVFLTDVVVELGFVEREKIDRAVRDVGQSGKTVEQYLLDSGMLDEDQLSLAVAERNGLDHVDLDRFEVDMEAAETIGRSAALRYRAVPIAFGPDGALIVAAEDPFDSLGVCDIEVMTRCEVRTAIASAGGIRRLIERLPEEPAATPPPTVGLPQPQAGPKPQAQAGSQPQTGPDRRPDPRPTEPRPEPSAAPPRPSPAPDGALGDLSAELRALQETARKADALAAAVERRIEELEGMDERAQQLERELHAARERNAELERRLSGVDTAAAELRVTTGKLEEMYRVLEESIR